MNYRKATLDDIKDLSEIRKKQLIDEGSSPDKDIDQNLYEFFYNKLKDNSLVEWVLEDNKTIIATGAVLFCELPPSYINKSGVRAYVTNMYTSPEYRGQGIATNMLKRILEECKLRKVEKIFLSASKMGRPVYLKFGFKESDEWLQMDTFK